MESTKTSRFSCTKENKSNIPQQDKFNKWLEKEVEDGLIDIHISMMPDVKCSLEEGFAELNAVVQGIDDGTCKTVIGECFKCGAFILEDEEHKCSKLV